MRFFLWSLLISAAPCAWAELVFEKPVQSLHRMREDGHVEARFPFKNTGPDTVTIAKVRTTCGCTSAKLDRKVFAPGEGSEVVVRFSFLGRKGAQRKMITVVTTGKKETPLDLRVWIHEPLTIAPALVYWKVGEPPNGKAVRLTTADEQITIKNVSSSNPRIAATLAAAKPGEAATVMVTPTDTAQKESAELTVQTDFPPDAPRSYTIHARVK